MSHHQQRHPLTRQIIFEPFHHIYVKVVGRFVEYKHVRLCEQDFRKSHTFCLASRQMFERHVRIRNAELRKHLTCQIGTVPMIVTFGTRSRNRIFQGSHAFGHGRQLFKIAYTEAITIDHIAGIIIFLAGKYIKKCCLTVAVARHYTYLIPLIHTESHILEQHPVAK